MRLSVNLQKVNGYEYRITIKTAKQTKGQGVTLNLNTWFINKLDPWFSTLATHENPMPTVLSQPPWTFNPVKPSDVYTLRLLVFKEEDPDCGTEKSYLLCSVWISDPQNPWTEGNGCFRPLSFGAICGIITGTSEEHSKIPMSKVYTTQFSQKLWG